MVCRLVLFVSLLMTVSVGVVNGQSEKPSTREITSEEITQFLKNPCEVKNAIGVCKETQIRLIPLFAGIKIPRRGKEYRSAGL